MTLSTFFEPLIDAPGPFLRETAQSYLSRLTGYYSCSSPKEFCLDFGLNLRGIQRGYPEAVRELAALTQCEANELLRWTPLRLSTHVHRLGEEEFHVRFGPRSKVIECPKCALEQISAYPSLSPELTLYSKAEWVVGYINACDKHEVQLLTFRAETRDLDSSDPAYLRAMVLQELLEARCTPLNPTSFEKYALSRLRGEVLSERRLIDTIPLRYIYRLALHLGREILKYRGTVAENSSAIAATGFDAFQSGEPGIRALLHEMRESMFTLDRAASLLPATCAYLSATENLELLRKIFASTFFDLLPYSSSDVLMGETCTTRTFHTLHSAHQAYDVPKWLLERFVEHTPGLAVRTTQGKRHTLINKQHADRLFHGRAPFLGADPVAEMHGYSSIFPHEFVKAALACGLIKRPPDPALADGPFLTTREQAALEVEAFSNRFRPIDREEDGLLPLWVASNKVRIPSFDLMQLAVLGRLKNVALRSGLPSYRALRVDWREALSLFTGLGDPITKAELGKSLGVNTNIAVALIDQGHVASWIPSLAGFRCRLSKVTSAAEAERFKTRYQLLRRNVLPPRSRTVSELRKAGLNPAICIEINGLSPAVYVARSESDSLA